MRCGTSTIRSLPMQEKEELQCPVQNRKVVQRRLTNTISWPQRPRYCVLGKSSTSFHGCSYKKRYSALLFIEFDTCSVSSYVYAPSKRTSLIVERIQPMKNKQ